MGRSLGGGPRLWAGLSRVPHVAGGAAPRPAGRALVLQMWVHPRHLDGRVRLPASLASSPGASPKRGRGGGGEVAPQLHHPGQLQAGAPPGGGLRRSGPGPERGRTGTARWAGGSLRLSPRCPSQQAARGPLSRFCLYRVLEMTSRPLRDGRARDPAPRQGAQAAGLRPAPAHSRLPVWGAGPAEGRDQRPGPAPGRLLPGPGARTSIFHRRGGLPAPALAVPLQGLPAGSSGSPTVGALGRGTEEETEARGPPQPAPSGHPRWRTAQTCCGREPWGSRPRRGGRGGGGESRLQSVLGEHVAVTPSRGLTACRAPVACSAAERLGCGASPQRPHVGAAQRGAPALPPPWSPPPRPGPGPSTRLLASSRAAPASARPQAAALCPVSGRGTSVCWREPEAGREGRRPPEPGPHSSAPGRGAAGGLEAPGSISTPGSAPKGPPRPAPCGGRGYTCPPGGWSLVCDDRWRLPGRPTSSPRQPHQQAATPAVVGAGPGRRGGLVLRAPLGRLQAAHLSW